jgi:preprotein translocase subunit SecA
MPFFKKLFGASGQKTIKALQPLVAKINSLEAEVQKLTDTALQEKMQVFRTDLSGKPWSEQKEMLEKILPEVFALTRETARRKLGQRHYDVQLIGGMVLHQGKISEMKTGEGKTLTAALPVVLNALTGRGVHVVTPNDYLSRVGGGWMGPVYHSLGISVAVIAHEFSGIYDPDYESPEKHGGDERLRHWRPVERKEAYAADVTYGTNNEFGFDYLRDNMAPSLERMVQRPLQYAIVDEIDSILIDEARTPLIISAPAQESGDKYAQFARLVTQLSENEDYNVDEKLRAATLTEAGLNKMEKLLGVDNIYTEGGIRDVHHIEQALKAHTLFRRDKDYVVKDGEIIIVDEFTGRLMHGRRYSEGLHQAIEAKEGVEVKRESVTLATITFQNYFRMYEKLAGMTGTAETEAEEFYRIYGLETVVIPTNRENVRKDQTDLIYRSEEGKFNALIADIKARHEKGQPVLVGTIAIEKNELLLDMMERAGVPAAALNAKNHEKEAQTIADAGRLGAVTVATNMAGRGVDIILGGSEPDKNDKEAHEQWQAEAKQVREQGGLHVVGTERHESRRIDNQLRGRAGRQGDPGSTQFYLSMEDDLMRIFGGERMRNIMKTLRVPEDMPIENRIIARSIESAQKKVEEHNLVEYDDVINKHRAAIYRRRREILNIAGADLTPSPSPSQGEGSRGSFASAESLRPLAEDSAAAGELQDIIKDMIVEEVSLVVNAHTGGEDTGAWNVQEIYETTKTILPVATDFKNKLADIAKNAKPEMARQKITDFILEKVEAGYVELAKTINELVPQTESAQPRPAMQSIEQQILIRAIDTLWTEHLDVMDGMRRGISLRSYGQRDPLVEYKKEAFRLFSELNELIRKQVVYSIFKVGDVSQFVAPTLLQQAKRFIAPTANADSFSNLKEGNGETATNAPVVTQKPRDSEGHKVGRNDLCPCGSGKKYKKCHGK